MGAAFIKIAMMPNITWDASSTNWFTLRARSPCFIKAKPKITATNNTCRISPSANPLIIVVGMMFRMKSCGVCSAACLRYLSIAASLPAAAKPRPGCTRFATNKPMARANVEMISKYTIAFTATRPIFAASATCAIPDTIVQKMMGPMAILINFTNPVPSIFTQLLVAKRGKIVPTSTPNTMATRTCAYKGKLNLHMLPLGFADCASCWLPMVCLPMLPRHS
mmetsp:Transcript_144202/g.366056  ORF Transcript_144202/g.366056 Transcript_144202/m.366056 type:complete len:222 (-) Transcript_144202:43-708(-)